MQRRCAQGLEASNRTNRWIFTTNNPYFQWNAIAALAAAADTLKGWDGALAKDCLETAIQAWKDAKANQRGTRPAAGQTDRLRGIREKLFILSEPNRLVLSAFSK